MNASRRHPGALTAAVLLVAGAAHAATTFLEPGDSVQAALDAALPGDVLALAPGEYVGDLDFAGKAVTVLGAPDWASVLRGTGTGPVVTFAAGEGRDSILDGVVVTGGVATNGGGLYVSASSPTVRRTKVFDNLAIAAGSGIYVGEGSFAALLNNVVVYNRRLGDGDPHGIQIVHASPLVLNNTVVRTDSNGLLVSGGTSAPLVMNNVLAFNAGRGICDFSSGGAQIWYNTFFGNRKAALLTGGQNWASIESAQATIGPPRLFGNQDARPGFEPRIPRGAASGDVPYTLAPDALARDAGHPHPFFDDLDGTRNDAGATGSVWSILGE